MSFVLRWVFAFFLVAATLNPTEWNFIRWAEANYRTDLPLTMLFALVLLAGYIIYLRATLRSIGPFGVALVLGLFGSLVWVLTDYGWLTLENPDLLMWLGILALSFVLGVGLSWSFIRRALSGQFDVDDSDE